MGISGQTSKARGDLGAIHSGGGSVPRGARTLRRCGLGTRGCSPESLQTLVTPFRGLSEAVLSLCDWVKGKEGGNLSYVCSVLLKSLDPTCAEVRSTSVYL